MSEELTGFARWYKENREDLNARRRKRYAEDKAYRKKNQESVARYREVGPCDPVYVQVDGKRRKMYPIQHVAYEVDRKVITVQSWIDRGVIPDAIYKDASGKFFTTQQIKLLQLLVKEYDASVDERRFKDAEALSKHIHDRWGN